MTVGIEEMHEGIAEASDKGKPTLRRILATIKRSWTACETLKGRSRPADHRNFLPQASKREPASPAGLNFRNHVH